MQMIPDPDVVLSANHTKLNANATGSEFLNPDLGIFMLEGMSQCRELEDAERARLVNL